MIRIDYYKKDIKKICRALKVRRLDLIGSASRDDFDPKKSDIDVLVEFKGKTDLFNRYFSLKELLERRFRRRVDIIQKNAIKNPYIKRSLERDKVHVYGT